MTARSLSRPGIHLFLLSAIGFSTTPIAATEAVHFTAEQAHNGADAYARYCADCHGAELEGDALAAPLSGEQFDVQWAGKAVEVLLTHLRRMPLPPVADPGSLAAETYVEILAFLLRSNGLEAGSEPLPTSEEALTALVIPTGTDLERPDEPGDPPATVSARGADRLTRQGPVTDTELQNPPDEDWLLWRRTYAARGFSPLDQIDRTNVDDLAVAWRAHLRPGPSMPSPLIRQGVMYLHTFPDTTLALDATNGQVIWRFQYEPSGPSSKKMGVALSGEKIFVPTSDLHLLALDAKTGELLWDHDIKTEAPKNGSYQLRAAPLVAGGRVLQGIMSFRAPRGSFIVAVDVETGEESWRFNTVARPAEPGGETWNDLPLDARNGGSVWVTGSYDPELDLVYFGPAPTYDTAPLLEPVDKQGISNDALYTNATIALRPGTGELVWHYQHLANDQWDLDWAFERQIVTLPVDGRDRKAVLTVGKSAIVEAVDAATGEYLFSIDLGLQNVISYINPETGHKSISPDAEVSLTETRLICPSAVGARSWPPTSFDPESKRLYLPLTEGCMTGGPDGSKGLLTSGVGLSLRAHPDSSDGNMGRFQAVDLETRQLSWSHRQPTPLVSAALATAGGVVFYGDLEPSLKAFDARTGDRLWHEQLDDMPGSNLISYSVDGRQYVALVVGQPNNVTRDWNRTYRRLAETLHPNLRRAARRSSRTHSIAEPRSPTSLPLSDRPRIRG